MDTGNHEGGLYRLIYFSRAVQPPADKSLQNILDDITQTAMFFNLRNQVTGALLYCDGWFMQALEGSREKVEETYFGHIQYDKRHQSLQIIDVGLIDGREFSQWNMASLILNPDEVVGLDLSIRRSGFKPAELSCEGAVSLLHVVSGIKEREFYAIPTKSKSPNATTIT